MGAVWMRLRAELRAGWRSLLGLALVAGLAGGLVIAAAAGARRTDTAYERMGVAGGLWGWTALAERVGVVPAPRVPLVSLLLTVPAAALMANLVAAIPGRVAARTQPAIVLRAK